MVAVAAACVTNEINEDLHGSIVQTAVTFNITPIQPESPLHADPNVTLIPSVVTSRPERRHPGLMGLPSNVTPGRHPPR